MALVLVGMGLLGPVVLALAAPQLVPVVLALAAPQLVPVVLVLAAPQLGPVVLALAPLFVGMALAVGMGPPVALAVVSALAK